MVVLHLFPQVEKVEVKSPLQPQMDEVDLRCGRWIVRAVVPDGVASLGAVAVVVVVDSGVYFVVARARAILVVVAAAVVVLVENEVEVVVVVAAGCFRQA